MNRDFVLGIIGAMDVEVNALKELIKNKTVETISGIDFIKGTLYDRNIIVAKCGVGKTYAAVCAQTMIIKYNPDTIINIGVAGGDARKVSIGDIVVADKAMQHDYDTSPIGDPKCQISGIELIYIPCDNALANKIYECMKDTNTHNTYIGTIASGDCFMDKTEKVNSIADEFGAIAFDMETASIAQVCFINDVKFTAIRAVSDAGGEMSAEEFNKFVDTSAETAISAIKKYIMS